MMPRPDDGNALRGVALPTQATSFLTMPVASISFISKHVLHLRTCKYRIVLLGNDGIFTSFICDNAAAHGSTLCKG